MRSRVRGTRRGARHTASPRRCRVSSRAASPHELFLRGKEVQSMHISRWDTWLPDLRCSPPSFIHPVPLVEGEGTSGGTLQMPPVTPATEVTPQESTSCSRPGPTWVSPVPGVVVHRMLPGPRSFPSCSPSFRSGAPESSASIGRAGGNTREQRSIEGGIQGRDGVGSRHFRPHPAPGTQSHDHR